MVDRNEQKARYYAMRTDGARQKDAAAAVGISSRTAQRWDAAARGMTTEEDAERARQGYAAKLAADQQDATREIIDKLARAAARIDFDELPPAETLKLLLRFMRYSRELADALPYEGASGALSGDIDAARVEVLEAQESVLQALASGDISEGKARQLLALLSEIRKSAAAADGW